MERGAEHCVVLTGQKPAAAALTAIRAHQRASQQGNVDSILAIGDAFYYGRGVSRDWPTAFQVYSAAARFRNAQVSFLSLSAWPHATGNDAVQAL